MKIEFNGENKRFLKSKTNRKLLIGPSFSGKTYTSMILIHLNCIKYPGTKVLMTRKYLPALRNTCFRTYEKVLNDINYKNIRILGGNRPTNVLYNKSVNEVDGKVYSGISEISLLPIGKFNCNEYDIVFVDHPETEGLTLNEFLMTISCARENNNPRRQIIAESNLPIEMDDEKRHWLWELPSYGFEIFNPNHKDNPQLYN